MLTVDEIETAIYKVLQSDTTLQGASYLNGTSYIYKGPRRPEQTAQSTQRGIIINGGGSGIATEGALLQDHIIYISAFVENNENGTAKGSTLSLIAGRIESLLNNVSLSISGARVFNCYLTGPHYKFFEPSHPDEHYVTSTFRVQAIKL